MNNALVLVGMKDYATATKFLSTIAEGLFQHGIPVQMSDKVRMCLVTPHAEIRFVYNHEYQQLDGLRADVVFGLTEYAQPLHVYLKRGSRVTPTMGLLEWLVTHENSCTMHDNYVRQDVANTALAATVRRAAEVLSNVCAKPKLPEIKCVHFSGPVTCVIWTDGTKTLVRCGENDVRDPEKGLAMAIAKKVLGTNESGSNYYETFKKFLPKPEETVEEAVAEEAVTVEPAEPVEEAVADGE